MQVSGLAIWKLAFGQREHFCQCQNELVLLRLNTRMGQKALARIGFEVARRAPKAGVGFCAVWHGFWQAPHEGYRTCVSWSAGGIEPFPSLDTEPSSSLERERI